MPCLSDTEKGVHFAGCAALGDALKSNSTLTSLMPNSAHENQMEAYSQVGPGGGKEMPSHAGIDENDPFAQPSYASSAAGGGGGAGSDLHQVSVASSYASTMMSQRETELIEEPPADADAQREQQRVKPAHVVAEDGNGQ